MSTGARRRAPGSKALWCGVSCEGNEYRQLIDRSDSTSAESPRGEMNVLPGTQFGSGRTPPVIPRERVVSNSTG